MRAGKPVPLLPLGGPAAALRTQPLGCIAGRWRLPFPRGRRHPRDSSAFPAGAAPRSGSAALCRQRRDTAGPAALGSAYLFSLASLFVFGTVFVVWGSCLVLFSFGLVCFVLRFGWWGFFGHGVCCQTGIPATLTDLLLGVPGLWMGPLNHSLEQLALVMVGFNFGCSSARAVWGHKLCSRFLPRTLEGTHS